MILRKDNSPEGEIVKRKNDPLLKILNMKSNEGENSFIFRYRLSAQLLMSTRGVFVEKITSRSGQILALQLLPPQYTSPIPDANKFVSGYEIKIPGMNDKVLAPNKVIWIRRPHPLNPYLSLTPMESAGVAIEIENLAKIYNRNFLLNDGRPGGLLVVRGEMDEDDKDELRSRFRGNLNRVGVTSVIASDDGVDFVDTGSNPRDAAYTEMRQITKEEILAAFGVPESVIGNAAGRTFSNAAEELRVFWMETMLPHLEPLARALDDLDEKYYVDFNTSDVPIMIISKQERDRYLKEEFQTGLISVNEYRMGRGLKTVKSDLADSLLANPNLTPIANTEKEFKPEAPGGVPGVPGMPPAPMPPDAGALPPEGVPAVSPEGAPPPEATPEDLGVEGQLSESTGSMEYKAQFEKWFTKSEQDTDRWTEILDHALERFFERQQRVVTEKALGAKSKTLLDKGELKVSSVFDETVWDRQLEEDISPIISGIIQEGADSTEIDTKAILDGLSVKEFVDNQIKRLKKINQTTKSQIEAAITSAQASKDDRLGMLKTGLAAVFAGIFGNRKKSIAETESQAALNAGVYISASKSDGNLKKEWVSKKDEKVRIAHRDLDGMTVPIDKSFEVNGLPIRFPGDPLAPPSLTIGCRCKLKFTKQ
jgi:HK97 family phage portal protein